MCVNEPFPCIPGQGEVRADPRGVVEQPPEPAAGDRRLPGVQQGHQPAALRRVLGLLLQEVEEDQDPDLLARHGRPRVGEGMVPQKAQWYISVSVEASSILLLVEKWNFF